jgi:RNA polymerase sigma factor (TIGR02999 family)
VTLPGGEVTRLLAAAADGDRRAAENLYGLVYGELRQLAQSNLRRERSGHTLQPTALVNEVYQRLAPAEEQWANRRHFFHAAATAMRRILVDHARKRGAQKRGAGAERVTLADLEVAAPEPDTDLLRLDAALDELAREDARLAELVALRFFVGLGIEEAAAALGVSPATAKRDWAFARAWLQARVGVGDGSA